MENHDCDIGKNCNTNDDLTKKIEACFNQDVLIEELFAEFGNTSDERDELKEKYSAALIQIEKANERIRHLEDQCEGLKNEIKYLSEDNESPVTHVNDQELPMHTEMLKKEPQNCKIDNHDITNSDQSINLDDSGVDLSSLTKIIDDRIEEKLRNCYEPQNTANSEEEIVKTLFSRRTGSADQTITQPLRNDTELREQNIVIHGIYEGNHTDAQYLCTLFNILGLNTSEMRASHRLGIKQNERKRPLKIVMKSIDEKTKLMSRLGRLRNASEQFKKIRVTDDYTMEEREEIKRWVILANESNKNVTKDYAWKVRGTPKTGLRLARVNNKSKERRQQC